VVKVPDDTLFGFHRSIDNQTYGMAEYDTSRHYKNASDISALSHEIAEWYDDPFGDNPTPHWGHIGQVDGCQSNLEVGDPLSGHFLAVSMPNDLTYHPQEVAFFSWFFDQVPSLGKRGRNSGAGTLKGPAKPCE
jgi:hypothetical protein